jgi:Fic family protein
VLDYYQYIQYWYLKLHIPLTPPSLDTLIDEIVNNEPRRFGEILSLGIPPDPRGKYYHWDKLRHLKPPQNNMSHKEWWLGVKFARKSLYSAIPHTAKDGTSFVYGEPNIVRSLLHEIDFYGGGELRTSSQVANPATRDTYLINSLIEEAITSSQLEGAATTRKVAKEMLRQKREPLDKSERMIVNNYHAMEYINDIASEDLTPGLILELHRILSQDTLDNPATEGKLRSTDDIYVGDERDATVLHIPPIYKELPKRLESICNFANRLNKQGFIHPVIRAIVLHFLLAYDHPFEDGNGRTARALFYWSMLRQGYWTMEFVSISRILKNAPAQYTRSYLYTETDDNDVTYFILHQLEAILKAIQDLFGYLEKKSQEMQSLERLVKRSSKLNEALNHRQMALLSRAVKDTDSVFTVESHRGSHNVTYDTARTDLLKMVKIGVLAKSKAGRAFVFRPVKNLNKHLRAFDGNN